MNGSGRTKARSRVALMLAVALCCGLAWPSAGAPAQAGASASGRPATGDWLSAGDWPLTGGRQPSGMPAPSASAPEPADAREGGVVPIGITAEDEDGGHGGTWIAKWRNGPPAGFLADSVLVEDKAALGVQLVRPRDGLSVREWAARWRNHPDLAYLHPNRKVALLDGRKKAAALAHPNDEYYTAQDYLRQIQAPAAWDLVRYADDVTVAVIDTGVDLTHPDLAGRLVEGINLIDPGSPPQDDHGHGTNVAGVIAAVGNNGIGVTGLAWSVKLMPIKALEADGQGDEDKLGEAIRHAVDAGADIVVMSLGLNRYSPFLKEIVDYAEQKGVLLVAAAGNEGRDVKFPAAFPTVLAVGGVSGDNRVRPESNHGPEIDLVAPWEVFTTDLGGGYAYNQGTSMAAPQAAGAAALALAAFPHLKPYELRNLLRQTALDIGEKGWDPRTGYGLLQVDRALSGDYLTDMYEPNDDRLSAAVLPLDTEVYGELAGGSDRDWFEIRPDYRGTVTVHFAPADAAERRRPNVRMVLSRGGNAADQVFEDVLNHPPSFAVGKGERAWIALQLADGKDETGFLYRLRTEFAIYADDFEDNDRQFKAYSMTGPQMTLTGTFHKLNDQDWFTIHVAESASLNLVVEPDTMRMDIALLVQKSGEKAVIVDRHGDGGSESLTGYVLSPGRYYILVHNVIDEEAHPVRGEYRLSMQIVPKMVDPNEPNNRLYQATRTVANTDYYGQFEDAADQDWFELSVAEESLVEFLVDNIPKDRMILMTLFDAMQTQKQLAVNAMGEERVTMRAVLGRGTYYLKLGASQSFSHQLYRFRYTVSPLVAGFRDIRNHWAEKDIAELVKRNAISGYGDYTFRPNETMSRAEAVSLLVNAFRAQGTASVQFRDVRRTHWAYEAIRRAVSAGIVTGFSDGSFRPDQKVTRAEMAAMLGRAMGLKELPATRMTFSDVRADHWASGWIERLVHEGILSGYADRTFRPEQLVTRAEVAVMVRKALDK